jgi:hypothetical protein
MLELNNYISSGLQADLDNGMLQSKDDVVAKLMSFYDLTDEEYELDRGEKALTISTSLPASQVTMKDLSSSKKDLSGKIAGNDATGQHKDWSTEFVGWGAAGDYTPETLVLKFFDMLGDNAEQYLLGNLRQDALGNDITSIYVTENGQDLKQLVQKFLGGAVAFSQGTDDYLDSDVQGKGLLADNLSLVDGKSYTNLEHQFDEGFGYFGAARNYLDYSDDEIASKGGRDDWQGHNDMNGDGEIDFTAEYNFGHSTNAAKRDRGTASSDNPTDFTADAMNAFLQGRQIITNSAGSEMSAEDKELLLQHRDAAVMAWEKSIAATVVHYINDTNGDYAVFGTEDFNYANLAKHWSELKGFALALQFNPRSPLTDEDFATVQTLIGDAPVLVAEDVDAYVADLEAARGILTAAYEFDTDHAANW